jgi:trigger factor
MTCLFDFTKEKTKGILKVTIPLTDIEVKYQQKIKENLPKIKAKGFRPGHVPVNIVEKQYGQQFKFDALNDILSEEFKSYIDKENITPISQAHIDFDEKDIDFTKDVKVTLTFDLPPYAKLGDITTLKTDRISIEVTDKDIEKEIEAFKKRYISMEEVDSEIEKDYYADITAKAYDENGELLRTIDRTLKIGENLSKLNLDDHLLKLKKGDTTTFEVSYGDDVVFSDFKNKKIKYEVTINSVKLSKLPDLTDEFVKEKANIENVELFKKDIEKKLKNYAESFEKNYNLAFIYGKIKSISEIEIPQSLIEDNVENTIDRYAANTYGIKREQLEQILKATKSSMDDFKNNIRPSVVKDIEVELILDSLIKEKQINPTEQMWQKLKEDLSLEIEDKSKIDEEIEKRKENYEYYLKRKAAEDYILENVKTGKIKKYEFKDIAQLSEELEKLNNPSKVEDNKEEDNKVENKKEKPKKADKKEEKKEEDK